MPCYSPIKGYRKRGGGLTFKRTETTGEMIQVPCNGCIGCRLSRSREWAIRCMHEASLHQENSFITLTYDEEHIPDDHGLRPEHFQKFMKRLRFKYRHNRIRFYMAGEYGGKQGEPLGRPHYHALLFGFNFNDRYLWDDKRKLYRSEQLEKLWPFGFCSIGTVNFKTAAYVARYVMKKINGDLAEEHYQKTDSNTGEIYRIHPEYNSMSLRPGIAYEWYQKYQSDVFPHDHVIVDGRKMKTPAYYSKLFKKHDPEKFEEVKKTRVYKARQHADNNTPERLAVREKCTQASLNRTERKLQ